jgi:hypothetical protein
MYKVHQDALMVPSTLICENYTVGKNSIPALNISSSIDKDGKMHISICNLHATKTENIACNLNGYKASGVTGQILTASKLNAFNNFDSPNNLSIQSFSGFKLSGNSIDVNLPPHSVIVLEVSGEMILADKSVDVKDAKPGLQYKYYDGNWTMLPNFTTLKEVKTGIAKNTSIVDGTPDNNYGLVYSGYIKVEKSGMYEFMLTSDDGSKLVIDDENIVINDGLHGMIEQQGSQYMKKGFHKFELSFFQGGGGAGLQLLIQGGDLNKQPIPETMLWH